MLRLERTGDASERLETRVTFRPGQMEHTFRFLAAGDVDVGEKRVPR